MSRVLGGLVVLIVVTIVLVDSCGPGDNLPMSSSRGGWFGGSVTYSFCPCTVMWLVRWYRCLIILVGEIGHRERWGKCVS